jgi:hypothetical protein
MAGIVYKLDGLKERVSEKKLTVMARTVEQITTARRVEVEENAGDDDDFLLETSLEEVEAVGNGTR